MEPDRTKRSFSFVQVSGVEPVPEGAGHLLEQPVGRRRQPLVSYSHSSNFLRQNTILLHLDLSCNKFTHSESKQIAEALEANQTIFGFHFKGNYGFVDNLGFLVVDKNERNCDLISFKSINSVKPLETVNKMVLLTLSELRQLLDLR